MRLIHKISAILISVCILLSFSITTIYAEDYEVSLETNKYEVSIGDTCTVNLNVSSDKLAGGNAVIEYDNSLVKLVSVTKADVLKNGNFASSINENYTYRAVKVSFAGSSEVSVNGTIITLTFEALSAGTAKFDLKEGSMCGEDGVKKAIGANSCNIVISDSSSNTNAPITLKVVPESSTAVVGEDFVVDVKVSGYTEISGGNFVLEYNDAFDLKSVEKGDLISKNEYIAAINEKYANNTIKMSFAGASNGDANGTICRITFVPKYEATNAWLTFVNAKFGNESGASVDFDKVSATEINIIKKSSSENTTEATTKDSNVTSGELYVSAPLSATIDKEFTASVNLRNCAEGAGGEIVLQYDSDLLELVDCTAGEALKKNAVSPIINKNYTSNKIYITFANADNMDLNGEILNVTFKPLKNGTAKLNLTSFNISDYNIKDIDLTALGSEVVIADYILGDVNNDKSVNYKDAILILRSSAEDYTLTDSEKLSADVNKDGDINYKDSILILRYAAGTISSFE